MASRAAAPIVAPGQTQRIVRQNAVVISASLLVATTAGDWATGVDIGFTLLYVFPVALGAWFRGRRVGYAFAVAAFASGVLVSVVSHKERLHPAMVLWNEGGSLAIFLLIAVLLDRLRDFVAAEQRERALAISQLRHAERLNVIGTLAAGVAHELGNPLNVIMGSAELMVLPTATPERLQNYSKAILRQGTRMTVIISHLLEFGRRGGTARKDTVLGELVDRTIALLQKTAQHERVTLVHLAHPADLHAMINASEIEQVLANLVINAVHAANGKKGEVRIGCSVDGPEACLVVEDDGAGIAPADLPKIFDPFFTTKEVGKGTGLGLSVSYGIVEDHGGTISVTSQLGKGTRFVVHLPLT